jgi:hypothetical protein
MSAAPAACAGATKLIDVALDTTRLVPATPPTVTPVAPVKLVPVRVIVAPPAVLVVVGELLVTVGGALNVYAAERVVGPAGFVMTRSTGVAEAVWLGVVTVSTVPVLPVTVARFPPKATVVTPPKFEPVIVTVVPPLEDPVVGLRLVIVGAPVYVKPLA